MKILMVTERYLPVWGGAENTRNAEYAPHMRLKQFQSDEYFVRTEVRQPILYHRYIYGSIEGNQKRFLSGGSRENIVAVFLQHLLIEQVYGMVAVYDQNVCHEGNSPGVVPPDECSTFP